MDKHPGPEWIHIDQHRAEINALVDDLSRVKSGKKIRRKVNQIYGKQLRKHANSARKELDAEIERRLEVFNSMVKPKPKWLPTRVWRWLQTLLLKDGMVV